MSIKKLAALAAMTAVLAPAALAQDTTTTTTVTTQNATVHPSMSDEAIMRDAMTWIDGYERYTFMKMLQLLPANDANLIVTAVKNCHRHAWDAASASWARANPTATGTDAMATRSMRRTWSPWMRSNTMKIETHMNDRLTTMERRQMGDLWDRLTDSERDVVREIIHNCMTMYGMAPEGEGM